MDGSFLVFEFWFNVLFWLAMLQLAGGLSFAGFVAFCLLRDDWPKE